MGTHSADCGASPKCWGINRRNNLLATTGRTWCVNTVALFLLGRDFTPASEFHCGIKLQAPMVLTRLTIYLPRLPFLPVSFCCLPPRISFSQINCCPCILVSGSASEELILSHWLLRAFLGRRDRQIRCPSPALPQPRSLL